MSRDKSNRRTRLIPVHAGERYGRLTIIEEVERSEKNLRMVRCNCDCGKVLTLPLKYMKKGNTSSCGCLRKELVAAKNLKHGHRKRSGDLTPEYNIWKRMRQRCNDPTTHEWERYGGRGIKICQRWDDYLLFLKDVGPRPSKNHSLDRIDNNGNYEPANVRWASASEQSRNKRNNARVHFDGEDVTIIELAEKHGVSPALLYRRIYEGWPVERALKEPLIKQELETVEYNGERHTISEWAEITGIDYGLLASRLRLGWDAARMLTTPRRRWKRKA